MEKDNVVVELGSGERETASAPMTPPRLPEVSEVDLEAARKANEERRRLRAAFTAAMATTLTIKPEVGIVLADGKEYKLEFTLGACLGVKRETGKNPGRGEVTNEDLEDEGTMVSLLFHGLQRHHGEQIVAASDLEPLLSIRRWAYYAHQVGEALSPILPDAPTILRLQQEAREEPEEVAPFPMPSGGTGSGGSQSDY